MIIFWITDFAPGAFVILTITALAVTGPRFRYSKGSSHFLISAKAFKELPVLFLCCFRRFGVDGPGSLIIRILGFTGAPVNPRIRMIRDPGPSTPKRRKQHKNRTGSSLKALAEIRKWELPLLYRKRGPVTARAVMVRITKAPGAKSVIQKIIIHIFRRLTRSRKVQTGYRVSAL